MTEPLKACPFWSRVAVVNGITLALCSAEDLERQRERGFDELEGCQRQRTCVRSVSDRPNEQCLGRGYLVLEPSLIFQMEDVWKIAKAKDHDTAWTLVLEWAAQQWPV